MRSVEVREELLGIEPSLLVEHLVNGGQFRNSAVLDRCRSVTRVVRHAASYPLGWQPYPYEARPGSDAPQTSTAGPNREDEAMSRNALWWIAAALIVVGIIVMITSSVVLGIILIILGLGVGPGGWTFLKNRR